MKKSLLSLFLFISVFVANSFGQYNVQLIGKKTYTGQNLSGSWGYNDTINNKEYALVGTTKGLSIVDITTPTTPVEVKFFSGSQGLWREVQTWKHYAYITQDDNSNTTSEGVLIYDLNQLPAGKADTFKGTTVNDFIIRNHSLYIDEKGFLYLNGGDVLVNGIHTNGVVIYDLKPNPMKPTYVGFTQNLFGTGAVNYVHDCYVRNDTMYQAHIYNNRFTVWDVRDRANPIKIQDFATPYSTIHNMWLSNDSKTLFVSHEEFGFPAEAYDISDLNNIRQLCEFRVLLNNQEILHNIHVKDDYIIASYYSDGLAIFDASDPTNVITVGYYDTQPTSTQTENGVWGAYGFYKSGLITLSDMIRGLHVVQPTYKRAARIQGTVSDTNTLNPIAGATFSFVDTAINTSTSIDGFYKTGSVKAGYTRFRVQKTGYITKFFDTILVNGQILNVDVKLRQIPVYSTKNVKLCNSTTYTLPDGRVVSSPGAYISDIVLPSGKDSIITTNLTIGYSTSSFQTSFCQNKSYRLPSGKVVTSAGTYVDTLSNFARCDSFITIILSSLPTISDIKVNEICQGQTFNLPKGKTTTVAGIFNDTLVSAAYGCDSFITNYVYVNPVYSNTKNDTINNGQTYTLPNGNVVSVQGTYNSNLSTTKGCDSIITVNLVVLNPTGIKNNQHTISLQFYLNNNVLNIVNKTNAIITQLDIYNSVGTLVQSFAKPANQLNLKDLPKDLYIIKAFTSTNEQSVGKIVIY